jgi:hypothetical protein
MKLSIGIVGLPNVGKSTLFKLLTKNDVNIANYPFCTIDPNVGIVPVPDERIDKLAAMSKSAKKIPAIVEFYDIAGLVKGASKGEGLGNKFLTHIKETNAIVEVLRCFASEEIVHVENSVNPIRDMEIINAELAIKDLETVEGASRRIEGEAKSGNKEARKVMEAMTEIKKLLEAGKPLWPYPELLDFPKVKEMNLLMAKPQIYLLNGEPSDVSEELKKKITDLGAGFVIANLSKLENLNDLIKKSYEILNLISFFTTGEDETRAWTIARGAKAPEAAGAIHSDFEKKFIRAEVIGWQKLLEAGFWSAAKQKGWLRLEGKDYVVQDGDVMEIRHG